MEGRQTRGRQRIEIKRIENEDDRLITFSKRRSGIYKKASELVTLCGAEVGVVIFSPAGKPFSFAHPSIESIALRFTGRNLPQQNGNSNPLLESYRQARINELNQHYDSLVSGVESEKSRSKVLKQMTEVRSSEGWWEAPIEDLGLQELGQMKMQVDNLVKNLQRSLSVRTHGAPSSSFPRGSTSQANNPSASTPHGHDTMDFLSYYQN